MKENNNYPNQEHPRNFNFIGTQFKMWCEGSTIFGEFLGNRAVADTVGRFYPTSPDFYTRVGVDQKENANFAKDRDAMLNYCASDFVIMFWQEYKTYVKKMEIQRNF